MKVIRITQKILAIISLVAGCLFVISFIDIALYDLNMPHIFHWENDKPYGDLNLSFYLLGLPMIITFPAALISIILVRFVTPRRLNKFVFISLSGPLMVLFFQFILLPLLPQPSFSIRMKRTIVVEMHNIERFPDEKMDYLETWCKEYFPSFSEKYQPDLSLEEQDKLIQEIKEWFFVNKDYLFYTTKGFLLDEEAKKAGIPTEEYRKTHPWPKEENKDKQ